MATREELLRQRVNKIYPTGDIAPNLARTPRTVPIQTSGAPLTGPTLPNIARTPAVPITPPPPVPGTGMGPLGNQAGPPPMPGGVSTGMGALGNQPAAPPPTGPVDPLTNTPVAPRVVTPRPAVNPLTNQPIIARQPSTLGPAPVPYTPAAPPASPAATATPAARPFTLGGVANTAIAGLELARGVMDTADRTGAKMESGQGFWQGLGNTIKENLTKVADNPFGVGSITATVNALNESRVPTATESNASTRMIGNLAAPPAVEPTIPKPIIPSSTEEAARRRRMSTATTVARPEGTVSIQPNTGMVQTAPLTEKERIAGIAGRISPENPYGADVVGLARPGAEQGGWVGAATDAEAARNLQDRALQDQATQAEVARLNRATDALRSLREERAPAVRSEVDSIGGGPDKLDVASGRVINRDTPANVVADRMKNAGGKAAKFIGDAYLADKELQGREAQLAAKQGTGINPVDMGRFLLDQQKFAQQQGIDKSNLQLREKELKNKEAGTSLEQQKYLDTQRKDFIDSFSFSDKNAPEKEIGAAVFEMSRESGIPRETVAAVYEQVVKELGIDWAKGGPKSQQALNEEVMKKLKRETLGGK